MNSNNAYTRTFQEAVTKAFASLIADYDLQPHYGSFNIPDELLPTCERLAGYVRQYCKLMLEGDFSIWPKLLEQRRQGLNKPK